MKLTTYKKKSILTLEISILCLELGTNNYSLQILVTTNAKKKINYNK